METYDFIAHLNPTEVELHINIFNYDCNDYLSIPTTHIVLISTACVLILGMVASIMRFY